MAMVVPLWRLVARAANWVNEWVFRRLARASRRHRNPTPIRRGGDPLVAHPSWCANAARRHLVRDLRVLGTARGWSHARRERHPPGARGRPIRTATPPRMASRHLLAHREHRRIRLRVGQRCPARATRSIHLRQFCMISDHRPGYGGDRNERVFGSDIQVVSTWST